MTEQTEQNESTMKDRIFTWMAYTIVIVFMLAITWLVSPYIGSHIGGT